VEFLYADEHLCAVMKPSGLLVHRGPDRPRHVAMTLARDGLGRHVYPVHRLDRAASGVLIFALTSAAAAAIQAQFVAGTIVKRYLALARGKPPAEAVIDHPIEGAPALTTIRALETFDLRGQAPPEINPYATLLEAFPKTGRTHQIRRHCKHLGHPLVGDVRYGKGPLNHFYADAAGLNRLALHALEIRFAHPADGREIVVSASPPPDLSEPLTRLRALAPCSAGP